MSSAYQCDRCGKLYPEAPCANFKVRDLSKPGNKSMDLCEHCQKLLDATMDYDPKKEKGNE